MKLTISEDWCLRMAELEGNAEIGAGRLALDPTFDGEQSTTDDLVAAAQVDQMMPFGRLVQLLRYDRNLSIEKLAEDADVELADLIETEADPHHKPEPRTVYMLAGFFDLPSVNLEQIAGLTPVKDARLVEEGVRFAARSESISTLSDEQRAALEAYVAVLSEKPT